MRDSEARAAAEHLRRTGRPHDTESPSPAQPSPAHAETVLPWTTLADEQKTEQSCQADQTLIWGENYKSIRKIEIQQKNEILFLIPLIGKRTFNPIT